MENKSGKERGSAGCQAPNCSTCGTEKKKKKKEEKSNALNDI
jgi:hypothetical protein